jgi:hypothetical protein
MGTAMLLAFSAPTWAATVTIQPIQICDDGGGNCATTGFFEAETDKIWAQAGIDVNFLAMAQINETDYLDVTVGVAAVVAQETQDVMEAGRTLINDSAVTLAINMFFVDSLDSSSGFYGLGCGAPIFSTACAGGIGVFIAGSVFTFNSGVGRLDTIAHEIGHVLGLTHNGFGAGGGNNLMTSGGSRTVPGSINDIFPDGLDLSQLTQAQIDEALSSGFVTDVVPIPEPGTLVLLGIGLAGAAARRRRKKI